MDDVLWDLSGTRRASRSGKQRRRLRHVAGRVFIKVDWGSRGGGGGVVDG